MKSWLTEKAFYMITEYAKIHPEKTQAEIGEDCGGWSGNIVSRALSCNGSWAKYEEKKRNHREKYRNAKKKKEQEEKSKDTGNEAAPKTMIVSYDQMKALAKDVDNIRGNMELMVQIMLQLLDVWKGC